MAIRFQPLSARHSWSTLPLHLLVNIFDLLDDEDRSAMKNTCRTWRGLLGEHNHIGQNLVEDNPDWQQLPPELWSEIMSYLNNADLGHLSQSAQYLNEITWSTEVWRSRTITFHPLNMESIKMVPYLFESSAQLCKSFEVFRNSTTCKNAAAYFTLYFLQSLHELPEFDRVEELKLINLGLSNTGDVRYAALKHDLVELLCAVLYQQLGLVKLYLSGCLFSEPHAAEILRSIDCSASAKLLVDLDVSEFCNSRWTVRLSTGFKQLLRTCDSLQTLAISYLFAKSVLLDNYNNVVKLKLRRLKLVAAPPFDVEIIVGPPDLFVASDVWRQVKKINSQLKLSVVLKNTARNLDFKYFIPACMPLETYSCVENAPALQRKVDVASQLVFLQTTFGGSLKSASFRLNSREPALVDPTLLALILEHSNFKVDLIGQLMNNHTYNVVRQLVGNENPDCMQKLTYSQK